MFFRRFLLDLSLVLVAVIFSPVGVGMLTPLRQPICHDAAGRETACAPVAQARAALPSATAISTQQLALNNSAASLPSAPAISIQQPIVPQQNVLWGWSPNGVAGTGQPLPEGQRTGSPTSNLQPPTSNSPITSLWGGARHGIALKSDGTVWDWGVNFSGMLGDGTTSFCDSTGCTNERHIPIEVHGPGNVGTLDSITAIMGGEQHNFALKSDGTVWAWGFNLFGQLGDGTHTDSYTPVQVTNLISVTALGGRGYHSLALRSDGTAWTWGNNASGQLGNGTTISSSVPVQVLGLSGVLTITGGYNFSLAIMSDHTLRSWGTNQSGQLGDGGLHSSSSVPVPVSGLNNVIQVSGGWKHAVALRSDGTVWTWGQNLNGELGNGTIISSSVPIQVNGLSGMVGVSGGDCHTAALKSDGTVWTWGCNDRAQLGDATNAERHLPVKVSGLTNVTAIAARDYHNYALKSDGSVWAWGWNINGQLGDNTTTDRNIPVQVLFLQPSLIRPFVLR